MKIVIVDEKTGKPVTVEVFAGWIADESGVPIKRVVIPSKKG